MSYRSKQRIAISGVCALGIICCALVGCDSEGDQLAGADTSSNHAATADGAVQRRVDAPGADPKAGSQSSDDSTPRPVDRSATTASKATLSEKPPLGLGPFIPQRKIREILDVSRLERHELPGSKATARYNSVRLAVRDQQLGVGIQVWEKSSQSETKNAIDSMKKKHLGSEAVPEGYDSPFQHGFVSQRAGIQNLVFSIPPKFVVTLSCDKETCPTLRPLIRISRLLYERHASNRGDPGASE